MNEYTVTMTDADNGQIHEVPYACRWNPKKVSLESIANACAAEHTVASGKTTMQDGTPRFRHVFLPLAAAPK